MLETIYIDDCCKLRGKIASVFGRNISLFHAVQRITHTLRKKNPLVQKCMHDLRLVFREDGDSEQKRVSATPAPEVILAKLDKFIDNWRDVKDHNSMRVFTADSIAATERLKRHITAGCVSNIPPGGGTSKNERFHHHINSLFNRSRIGILLF